MEKRRLLLDLLMLWVSVTAFTCTVLNLYVSRNMPEAKDS